MSFDAIDDLVQEEFLTDNRLRWACRRGMLELDILLGGFIDNGYSTLSLGEKKIFQSLLLEADQKLLEYFMLQKTPEDNEVASVIQKIRNAVTN